MSPLALVVAAAIAVVVNAQQQENSSNVTLLETPDEGNVTTRSPSLEPRQLFPGLFGLPSPFPVASNVAFSVRKASENLRAFTRVHFRDVLTNIGGAWNPSTSLFTAPFDGGYYFVFHAVGSRTTDFTMALMKNGEYEVTAYGTRTSYEHGSNSAFLALRRYDRIGLDLQQGMIYEHPGDEAYTTFTGFLLFRL
ncbi:complement C1q-like protein 4 isoform X2 [Procambarus clarkii]|uniref:complement C1q-like protein 4 isoform X2 n=1 Tax=Procambarus clarkii TaxID=6728 RepID=UPI001E675835|nr:complement C1q-like protein 4 isoform X2 [Procambarus clarkii]